MKLTFDTLETGTKIADVVRHIDQDVIDRYAVASFDYNPIHIDPEWKEQANLPGGESTIAHGQMTMSFIASALCDFAYPIGGKITRLDAKYIRPVLPGDIITAGGTVSEKHFIGSGKDYVVVDISAENQNDEKVAVGTADVVLP